jgi:hypothetical protein
VATSRWVNADVGLSMTMTEPPSDSARDRDHLLRREAEFADRHGHVGDDPVALQMLLGVALHPASIDDAPPGTRLAAEMDVVGCVEGGDCAPERCRNPQDRLIRRRRRASVRSLGLASDRLVRCKTRFHHGQFDVALL